MQSRAPPPSFPPNPIYSTLAITHVSLKFANSNFANDQSWSAPTFVLIHTYFIPTHQLPHKHILYIQSEPEWFFSLVGSPCTFMYIHIHIYIYIYTVYYTRFVNLHFRATHFQ